MLHRWFTPTPIAIIALAVIAATALFNAGLTVMVETYGRLHTSMAQCLTDIPSNLPDNVTVVTEYNRIVSYLPLGMDCIYVQDGVDVATRPAEGWGQTIQAIVSLAIGVAAVIAVLVIVAVSRRRDRRIHAPTGPA